MHFLRRLRATRSRNSWLKEQVGATEAIDQYNGTVLFIAANEYGLSSKTYYGGEPMGLGDQLCNKRSHQDLFKIEHLEDNIITIESVTTPGLFIGAGTPSAAFSTRPFEAVLVNGNDGNHKLRIVPAVNGDNGYISIEPVNHRGYVLNHCNGDMFFSNVPNWDNTYVFRQDSSWEIQRFQTLEEQAMSLPTIRESSSGVEECPCCFEMWDEKRIQVLTECGHSYCMQCVSSICHMASPSTTGTCAMCRSRIQMSKLKRVIKQEDEG